LLLLGAAGLGFGDEWYISNAAGMALKPTFSRMALREQYALAVASGLSPTEIPLLLQEYYTSGFLIERRTLYRNGEQYRQQWIFRDGLGKSRVVAVINTPPEEEPPAEGEASPPEEEERVEPWGFIEVYNEEYLISLEHRLNDDGTDEIIRYYYKDRFLIRAEASIHRPAEAEAEGREEESAPEALWTDNYRYSRFLSLRSILRVYHSDVPSSQVSFPHTAMDAAADLSFVSPAFPYAQDSFEDVLIHRGDQVLYTTDERGRVLSETRTDEAGETVGVMKNTWLENRVTSVVRTYGDDERITEYEYDEDGNRVVERNYRNQVLERMVRIEGNQEVEELYMNGIPILRAIWKDGRKVSEERLRAPAGNSPDGSAPETNSPEGSAP
jgi:YD repeat-containing protein